LENPIVAVFKEVLGREPVQAEKAQWNKAITEGNLSLNDLRNTLVLSDEYKAKQPAAKKSYIGWIIAGVGAAAAFFLS